VDRVGERACSSSGQRGRAAVSMSEVSPLQSLGAREGDHRGIVGAIGHRRGKEGEAVL
jgi:hypothetical protein